MLDKFLGIICMCACFSWAQQMTSLQIEAKYKNLRPTIEEMAFYSLDWVLPFEQAQQRALAEKRPIFLIWVTNITGPTNFFSGHC